MQETLCLPRLNLQPAQARAGQHRNCTQRDWNCILFRDGFKFFTQAVVFKLGVDKVRDSLQIASFHHFGLIKTFRFSSWINARPHTSRVTMDALRQQDFSFKNWSPYSPYIWPIEHLWDELGWRVYNIHVVNSLNNWSKCCRRKRLNIPQGHTDLQRLIISTRRRLHAYLESDGGHDLISFKNHRHL